MPDCCYYSIALFIVIVIVIVVMIFGFIITVYSVLVFCSPMVVVDRNATILGAMIIRTVFVVVNSSCCYYFCSSDLRSYSCW